MYIAYLLIRNNFTAPVMGAVAKYCNEPVCVFVRLSLCVSVCPRVYLPNHIMRDLYQFVVHVAYRRGSVLLQQSDEIPRERGNWGEVLPH